MDNGLRAYKQDSREKPFSAFRKRNYKCVYTFMCRADVQKYGIGRRSAFVRRYSMNEKQVQDIG